MSLFIRNRARTAEGLAPSRSKRAQERLKLSSSAFEAVAPAFGVSGREKHAHCAALRDAEESRSLAPHRIHYGAHVVHPLLQRRNFAEAIGKAGSTFVEQDETAEGC